MIQINLIPDVKLEFIHAQQMRRVAISISLVVGAGAVGVVALLGFVLLGQNLRAALAQGNINSRYNSLKSIENIDNVLTLQNQLSRVDALNGKKTIDSRLFDILSAVNPAAPNDMKFSTIKLDPSTSTITIDGAAANGFAATETFRKTILNTTIESTANNTTTSTPLTSDVTISDTSYGEAADGSQVLRFTLSFVYPAGMLDNSMKSIRVVTPTSKVDVTDSKTRVPESLFTQKATDLEEGN